MNTAHGTGLDIQRLLNHFPQAAGMACGGECSIVVYDFLSSEPLVLSSGPFKPETSDIPAPIAALLDKPDVPDTHCYCCQDGETRILRHGISFIKDEQGIAIGCVGIVMDISPLLSCRHLLDSLLGQTSSPCPRSFPPLLREELRIQSPAVFGHERISGLIATCMNSIGIPPERMTNHDRMRVVEQIETENGFALKGAVDTVAEALGVTRHTVYYYRKKLHRRTV